MITARRPLLFQQQLLTICWQDSLVLNDLPL
jgi:hypothetical protein